MDLTFTPTIYLNSNLESLDKYKISTEFNLKSSGGYTELTVDNLKNEGSDIVASSVKFNSKQIINKNMIVSTNGLFTNSVSATRSINTQPITFEDIYIKSENFNLFSGDDYLKSEISSVSAFNATDINQVPLSPSVQYRSQFLLSNNNDLNLELDYRILKRDESSITNPSENHSFNLNNILSINKSFEGFNAYNKIRLNGSHNEYRFLESNLNRQESKLNFLLSSDIYLNNYKYASPRVKFIYPKEFISSNNLINEDSNSISFNYTNQYSDNRFYGNDLNDNTPRIVYGLENRFDLLSQKLSTKINQSYDLNKKNNYTKKINQSGHFSDYAIELKTNNENINFVTNLRIDKDELDKKEMSYSLRFNKPIEVFLSYNETDKSAFKEISQDTKALDIRASKKINNNLSLSYSSNLDLKNNYSPYSEKLTLSIFDECSKLDISYSNTRFNDNFNTLPEEKISLMYNLEYLGFLSEGENNLFK
jgi:lipopolysaccharide assembly outer membrane protein LptD (OstA)